MRKIKFRGIRVDNGEMIYGDLSARYGNIYIYPIGSRSAYQVKPETIGQYTGLTDKDGTEIYEGDIIHIKEFANEAFNVDFSSDDIRQLSLDDCKGRLLQEYKCIISFIDGNMMAKMISKEDCELYISSLFPDMRYSQPIFEFETIGNIHDNPELTESIE